MSGNLSTTVLPASGVGVQVLVAHLPSAAGQAARATLPFTGIAFAAYLALSLTLLLVGFVLRWFGGAHEHVEQL